MQKYITYLFCLIVVFSWTASTQTHKGRDVLEKVIQNYSALHDYTVNLQIDVDMDRLRIPRMNATLYYKNPDKFHLSASNFAIVPREGIFVNPYSLAEKYDASTVGEEDLGETKAIRLQLAAKDVQARVRQMYLWIDKTNWTIIKMEMIPFQNRKAIFEFSYTRHEEKYWLPQEMKAWFSLVDSGGSDPPQTKGWEFSPRMNEMRSPLRDGNITIRYQHYQINKGLSEEIFKKEPME